MEWIVLAIGFILILYIKANKEVIAEDIANKIYQYFYKEK